MPRKAGIQIKGDERFPDYPVDMVFIQTKSTPGALLPLRALLLISLRVLALYSVNGGQMGDKLTFPNKEKNWGQANNAIHREP